MQRKGSTRRANMPRVRCACIQCGRVFQEKQSRVDTGRGKFCTRGCMAAWMRGRPRPNTVGKTGPKPAPLSVRFWRYVDKDGPIPAHRPDLGPCWVWTAARERGYGVMAISRTLGTVRTHCFSWELHNGPIPPRMNVLHRCDNPPCVNPAHLWLGTKRQNTVEMLARGRHHYRHSKGELTSERAEELRQRHAAGESMASLSDSFGVTLNTVRGILDGRLWAHGD